MNRDDIIRIAGEAGLQTYLTRDCYWTGLEHFAALVAAHEREECAKVCETLKVNGVKADITGFCADVIRTRSKK